MQEHIDVINYLLKNNAIASQGVISAIIKGNVEILEKLFKYGATAKDNYSEDLVALLVNAAIPTNDPTYCKGLDSETKEDLSNYVETLKFLLEHGGNSNAEILERGKVIFVALFVHIAEPENAIYKDICKLLILHEADTSTLTKYKEVINKLMNDINNSDERYVSKADIDTKTEIKVTTISSKLEDTNFKSGIFHTFKTDQTSLNCEVKVFESEFFYS